jgi:hypothetical protein
VAEEHILVEVGHSLEVVEHIQVGPEVTSLVVDRLVEPCSLEVAVDSRLVVLGRLVGLEEHLVVVIVNMVAETSF